MKRLLAASLLLLASAAAQAREAPLEIAITIDDLPVHAPYPPGLTPVKVSKQMLAAFKAARVPAYGVVNAVRLQEQPEPRVVLADWRAAGMMLGSHGWSHQQLRDVGVDRFQQELINNERVLQELGRGTDWHWFRYPYLDEGKDAEQRAAARAILARRGYKVAAVTMGFSDWQWTIPYARCTAAKDTASIAELGRMYLAAAKESIAISRGSAQKLYGRDIPYVLLMHASALSARMMPQVIKLYRDAGFRFVTLAQAERDPVYRGYTDLTLAAPPSPQELASQKHVQLPQATDYSTKLAAMCAAAG
jgi:peptidoglycan-N-acetylglucosamine deacetylase